MCIRDRCGNYTFIGGSENETERAVEFDETIDKQGHTQRVDDVMQNKNRPDGFAQQPEFAK